MPGAGELPRDLGGGWEYIPPPGARPAGSVDAAVALRDLAAAFDALQSQAQRLQLPALRSRPALEAHCRAVGAYLAVARAVHGALRDQGLVVVQRALDAGGRLLSESRGAPLSPTTLAGCGADPQPAAAVEVMLIRGGSIVTPVGLRVRRPPDLAARAEGALAWVDRLLARAGVVSAVQQQASPPLLSGAGALAGIGWPRLALIAAGSLGGILLLWALARSAPPATAMRGCPCP
jgi:hypothetical protein